MTTTKGFKVTDADRKTRVGIAARSLEDLIKKTIDKFKLKTSPASIDFQMTDGTVIESEDYFETIPSQTLLIWVRKGERAETDAEILYKTIREVNDEYLTAGEKVHEFFTEKMKNKVFKLAEVLRGLSGEKSKLSAKRDDPEWFEGLDTTAKTKEEYMSRRAQDRVRTYFYKTKEELTKHEELPRHLLHALLAELQTRLKLNKYHGCYFDRASSGNDHLKSICDETGAFVCQGRWDKPVCLYKPPHTINPYVSREARIIFQTWNLDHQKERSRSVIPAICAAIRACADDSSTCKLFKNDIVISDVSNINVNSIYNDLFTTKNLKIVHIVCHDKGAHTTQKVSSYLLQNIEDNVVLQETIKAA